MVFDGAGYLTLAASLVGVTSLIFAAKGNPAGQALMVVFSLLYGIISYTFSYYGEMLTYLGMTLPMSVSALISWLKNPYGDKHSEVRVGGVGRRELPFMLLSTVVVTAVFGLALAYFKTPNLLPSTISVTTSWLAVYLTFRRSPYYALAYAANDIVLITLWSLASAEDARYIPVVVCFSAFFLCDGYGFISWRRMRQRQRDAAEGDAVKGDRNSANAAE